MAFRSAVRMAFPVCLVVAPLVGGIADGALIGNDREPPTLVVSKPSRGEYLTSSHVTVEGTASDAGSGIVALIVNGATVTLDTVTGAFSAPVSLTQGVNFLSVSAIDGAGNKSSVTVGAMDSESFAAAGALVRNAAASRASDEVLDAIGARFAPLVGRRLDRALAKAPLFHDKSLGVCVASADVRVSSVTFDVNQALFASWQSGFWNMQIDQAFLRGVGVRLPFELDSTLIAAFFPQLAGMLTPNQTVPLRLDLAPQMQPVIRVSDGPGVLALAVGELNLDVLLDLGAGFAPVLALTTHVEAGIAPVVDESLFSFLILPPQRLEADVIRPAPITLDPRDVERFIQFVVPPAIQLAAASIRPMPLPALQGLTLTNLRVYPDGERREYLTVTGDVR